MSRELSWRDGMVVLKLLRLLFRLKPRIVHTHKAKAGAAGRVAAQLYRWLTPSAILLRPRDCQIVHTYHGHIFHSYYGAAKTKLFITIERALARICTDRIITISEQQRSEIVGRFRVGRMTQAEVVPLGIDLDATNGGSQQLRKDFGLTQNDFLIGIVGRLCEVKNHSLMIAAAKLLKTGGFGGKIIVLGDGHLRGDLERKATSLHLDDTVIFAGFREDILSLYAGLDLVILTSLNEGTPLTLIEALGCGRAVAATEVGGVVDIMGRFRESKQGFKIWDHGITAKSGDAEGLSNGIRFLADNAELRIEMGELGSKFVRSRMSKERLISDIEKLYTVLISNSRVPSALNRQGLSHSERGTGEV
jgi:glycosyltransferase involved in cell wall biosynthesis